MARKPPKRKLRVDFRQNRQERRRSDDWTRQLRAGEDRLVDSQAVESVRAKGDLSRKRTIIVDDEALPVIDEALWRSGVVAKVHGLICYVVDNERRSWECTVRRILRTLLIQSRAPVTVGDRVWFSDQRHLSDGRAVGVIERVMPRTSTLSRRDRRRREQAIVANADQLLAVLSVAQPRLRPHLADRYLVAALKGGLKPILCFNKIDLLSENATTEEEDDEHQTGLSVYEVVQEFRDLGYTCVGTSALTGQGVDKLRELLQGHITVLSGQSGVGKSSLINRLEPGLDLPIRSVSAENEKGRHTTTLAELLPLSGGGGVVDTPGIRAFDLWAVQPGELEAFFEEFVPFVPQCRFRDCMHREEEGCAVRAAVEAGDISERRYFSYLKMFREV